MSLTRDERDEIEAELDLLGRRKRNLQREQCFGEDGRRQHELKLAALEAAESRVRRMLELNRGLED